MQADDVDAMLAAREALAPRLGAAIPRLFVIERLEPGAQFDAKEALADSNVHIGAILSGSLSAPELTGTSGRIAR